jgi:hypothetical protein
MAATERGIEFACRKRDMRKRSSVCRSREDECTSVALLVKELSIDASQ